MKNRKLKGLSSLLAIAFILFISSCTQKTEKEPETKYPYKEVSGDPLQARIYTLKNGLKVYLTVNKKEPRIQTYIAVRAGSKNDPSETTGLAHYLEHMLFKGTNEIGTLDWNKEAPILDSISSKFEEHRKTNDPVMKKAIYHIIDSLSYEASKYAVPNEYDKMISSLGAKGTNAYTWVEQTVYVNDIPANELEKWLFVESKRFQTLVLRLFHTELETVYEEFNRGQDNDYRKSWDAMFNGLFPSHPYGTQTTLGKGEHLKNPSMVNIHRYFDKYYVPNNMAICLSGDLDPDETIRLIDKYFGDWESKEVPPFTYEEQPEIKEPVVKEVYGVQPEHLYLGFRFNGADSRDAMMIELISNMLNNGQAGLIDLNLIQKQKVLSASSFAMALADYSAHVFYAEPREGQSLEQVKDLLLEQVEKIKKGEFDDWLPGAVVKTMKLNQIKSFEKNNARAQKFVDAFTLGLPWEKVVHEFDEMEKITKEDVVKFANEHYKNNYVVVYKRNGKDTTVYKVEKPVITPVVLMRDTQSAFVTHFDSIPSSRLEPLFVDYQQAIQTRKLKSDVEFSYIKNEENELFQLYYILDMGSDNDKKLSLAVKYLPYLGTDKYSAEDLQKEFFKQGLNFDVFSSKDKVYVTLSGLDESFESGIKLFEHILSHVQPDQQALTDMVAGILKERSDAKLEKSTILRSAMGNYAKYGPHSSFTNILSAEELKSLLPEELISRIKELTAYKHRIFYYGQKSIDEAETIIDQNHYIADNLKDYPPAAVFPELEMNEDKVYYVDYDMVQSELVMLSKGKLFDSKIIPYVYLFNEYFGAGLSSIVFQEIRESKALAYAAYCFVTIPAKNTESHYVSGYLGTQADKLDNAVAAMLDLLNDMPQANDQFEDARDAALKKIESERIVGAEVFWSYEKAKDRGLNYDIRKDVYNELPAIKVSDLKNFFDANVKGKYYTYLVIGKKGSVDKKILSKLGKVEELSLKTIFNY